MTILEVLTVAEHNRRVAAAKRGPSECRACPVAELWYSRWRCELLNEWCPNDASEAVVPLPNCPWRMER